MSQVNWFTTYYIHTDDAYLYTANVENRNKECVSHARNQRIICIWFVKSFGFYLLWIFNAFIDDSSLPRIQLQE